MTSKQLTAGSLFAGIGGFCLGFKAAGIRTVWAVENDPSAVETYRNNLAKVRVVEQGGKPASIKDVSVSGDRLTPVDVLHAGFPCQSFSTAGERRGFEDPRGQLLYEVFRLIHEFGPDRPSVLVLENAPNFRVGQGGAWFIELCREVRKAGYWFREESNCAELDPYELTELPQRRNRLFMVAFSTDHFKNGRFDFPSHKTEAKKDLAKFIDFSTEQADKSYYLPTENRYHRMISQKVDDRFCIYQLRKFLVRVKDPGVCPTLTANMGLGGHNVPFVIDTKGLRKLTEKECLRLQGFPESFEFPEMMLKAKRYMQVGNSVVPPIAELLGRKIYKKIREERK